MSKISILFFIIVSNHYAMQQESSQMDLDLLLYPFYYVKTNDLKALKKVSFDVLMTARDGHGNSLLHHAVTLERKEMMKFLIEETDLRIINNNSGQTPRDLAKRSKDRIISDWGFFNRAFDPNKRTHVTDEDRDAHA